MKNLFSFFKRKPEPEPQPDVFAHTALQAAAMAGEDELSCDEVYALIDQFAEMFRRGEDASHLMPLVEKHLMMCPDCREDYEALLRMMDVPLE